MQGGYGNTDKVDLIESGVKRIKLRSSERIISFLVCLCHTSALLPLYHACFLLYHEHDRAKESKVNVRNVINYFVQNYAELMRFFLFFGVSSVSKCAQISSYDQHLSLSFKMDMGVSKGLYDRN